jgi:hypothetical protein
MTDAATKTHDPITSLVEAITRSTSEGTSVDPRTGEPWPGGGPCGEARDVAKAHHARVRTAVESFVASLRGSETVVDFAVHYLDNKNVPPIAILVSGGKLAPGAEEKIAKFVETPLKGRPNYHTKTVVERPKPERPPFALVLTGADWRRGDWDTLKRLEADHEAGTTDGKVYAFAFEDPDARLHVVPIDPEDLSDPERRDYSIAQIKASHGPDHHKLVPDADAWARALREQMAPEVDPIDEETARACEASIAWLCGLDTGATGYKNGPGLSDAGIAWLRRNRFINGPDGGPYARSVGATPEEVWRRAGLGKLAGERRGRIPIAVPGGGTVDLLERIATLEKELAEARAMVDPVALTRKIFATVDKAVEPVRPVLEVATKILLDGKVLSDLTTKHVSPDAAPKPTKPWNGVGLRSDWPTLPIGQYRSNAAGDVVKVTLVREGGPGYMPLYRLASVTGADPYPGDEHSERTDTEDQATERYPMVLPELDGLRLEFASLRVRYDALATKVRLVEATACEAAASVVNAPSLAR